MNTIWGIKVSQKSCKCLTNTLIVGGPKITMWRVSEIAL